MNASPREIYNKFNERLYGCDDYKKGLSIFLWKILHGYKPEGALLIAGQSGSGKTEAIRILEKIYPNVRMIDGTRLTNEGFKGGCKIGSEIGQLIDDSHDFPEYPPILVIDEFDKVVFTSEKHETNYIAPPIIPEIYKAIEGCKITVEMGRKDTRTYDTKNLVFILMGSFSSYAKPSQSLLGFGGDAIKLKHDERTHMPTKDEILATLPAEMRGRTEDVIYVPELLKEDFREMLDDDRYSPLIRIGKKYGIEISADYSYKDFIAEQAYAEGTGVRELNIRIMRELNAALFDNINIAKLHITLNGSKITSKSDALDIELYEEVVNQMANNFINQHRLSNEGENTP